MDDEIYSIIVEDNSFMHQLRQEQHEDDIIWAAKVNIEQNLLVQGQFKRIQKQLRTEQDILTKSGRPIIP